VDRGRTSRGSIAEEEAKGETEAGDLRLEARDLRLGKETRG
jgi:hypothetical protein